MQYPFQLSLRRLLLCFLLLIATVVSLQAQSNLAYVDQNATGANDGTSWTDAYTHLSDALTDPTAEIWVAAGTYYPDTASVLASFNVHGIQQLYGGFAGNETMRSQRDYTLNPSIISGDIGQDDLMSPALSDTQIVGNNSHRLIHYLASSTSDVIIDGFTLTAGQNPDAGGGAIIALTLNNSQNQIKLSIRNCQFSANVAKDGGAIYAECSTCAQDILIEDCEFVGNVSRNTAGDTRGGAIYFWGDLGAIIQNQIRRSLFESNYSNWFGGAIYSSGNSYKNFMIIDSCSFSNNLAGSIEGGFGGAIFGATNSGGIDIKLLNSSFINNEAESVSPGDSYDEGGGAIHLYTDLRDKSSFVVENCQFISNRVSQNGEGDCINIFANNRHVGVNPLADLSLSFQNCTFNDNGIVDNNPNKGGAIRIYSNARDLNIDVSDSHFTNNHGQRGGAFYLSMRGEPDISLNILRSQFENNSAQHYGGSISIYDDNSNGANNKNLSANIEQCQFIGNTAPIGGAFANRIVQSGSGNNALNFKQNHFENNSSTDHGGAVFSEMRNINHHISFQEDTFLANQATNYGGAVSLISADGSSDYDINQIYLADNMANNGGAIYIKGGNSNPQTIELKNSQFLRNTAIDGGAILGKDLSGSFALQNSLMIQNQASNHAAALHITNQNLLNLSVLSSTFSQNTAQEGIDLFFVEGPNPAPTIFNIANTIMWNNGSQIDIVSLGNVIPSITYSLLDHSTPGNGNISLDPEFIDPTNEDFRLKWYSPAIDAGYITASSGLDLNGNPRIQGSAIDIGAYESPFTTPIESPSFARLDFYPNPSKGQIQLSLPPTQGDEVKVLLYDPLGRLVFEDRFAERSSSTLALDFGSLSAGVYLLSVQAGGQAFSESLIIQ